MLHIFTRSYSLTKLVGEITVLYAHHVYSAQLF